MNLDCPYYELEEDLKHHLSEKNSPKMQERVKMLNSQRNRILSTALLFTQFYDQTGKFLFDDSFQESANINFLQLVEAVAIFNNLRKN